MSGLPKGGFNLPPGCSLRDIERSMEDPFTTDYDRVRSALENLYRQIASIGNIGWDDDTEAAIEQARIALEEV